MTDGLRREIKEKERNWTERGVEESWALPYMPKCAKTRMHMPTAQSAASLPCLVEPTFFMVASGYTKKQTAMNDSILKRL